MGRKRKVRNDFKDSGLRSETQVANALEASQTSAAAQVQNSFVEAKVEALENGLGAAIGFPGSLPFPQNQGVPWSAQVENTGTLFKNLRWYFVSNFRQLLSQAYCEIGLIQTIVDVPVDDGLRGGIELKSDQLSEEQIAELLVSLDRDDDINTAAQAAKWNRLFGGAGIMIFTDQDPETPLDVESLNESSELEFRAVDMWELFWDKQNTEGYDPSTQQQDFEYYSYYGTQVHKSRVMRLKGITAPSFLRPRLRGWGFSVVETLVRSINQYLKATDLSFEVLDEFKLDVYKIKNLVNTLLSPIGQQKVSERVQMANWQKNYQNAVVMDSEDDFDHKQLSFSGLAEVMAGIRMQVASDMRMPITKLFGISAAGFNSGEDDIEVYNSMVESQVRNKLKYDLLRICEIKCQVMFGFIPDDLSLSFKPLRVLSAEQEENVKTQKFNRLIQARQAGEITPKEFRDGVNRGNLMDVTLDTSDEALNELDGFNDDEAFDVDQDPEDNEDVDNPGANRVDTKKPLAKDKGGVPKGGPIKQGAVRTKNESETKEGIVAGKNLPKAAPKARSAPTTPSKSDAPIYFPKPYTKGQRALRAVNSARFDRASYEADGGDKWVSPKREHFFKEMPMGVDQALWRKAVEASHRALGEDRWQFVLWWYKKQGGRFT